MTTIPETLLDRVILGDTTRSRQLVAEGWNVNHPDDFNRTYLHWAAQGNNADLIQLLLDCHADPHIRTKAGILPLHTAVNAGHTDAVRVLVTAGARLPDPEGYPFDKYALHWAAARGELEMVKLLVEKAEVALTHLDMDGKTAAQTALAHSHRKVARYLAKKSGESLPEADGSDNETTMETPQIKELTIVVKRELKEEEEEVKGKKAGGKAKETGKKEEKPRAKRKKKEVSESEESESSESDAPVKRRKTNKKAKMVESSSSEDETLESLSKKDEKGKPKRKPKKEKKENTKISLKIKVKDAPKKHKKGSNSEDEKPKKRKTETGKERERAKGGKGVKNGRKKKGDNPPDSPPPPEEKEEKKKKKKQNAHIYKELFKDDVFDVQTKIPKKKERVDDSRGDNKRPRDSYSKDRPMDSRDRPRDDRRDWDR